MNEVARLPRFEFWTSGSGDLFAGIAEFDDQDLAVGMECAAGSSLCLLHGAVRKEVSDLCDQASGSESLFNVIPLEVDVGIDLVGDAAVALVTFETDVVGGSADPQRFSIDLERRFPDTQVITRPDDTDGFGMGPAVILRSAKEIELTHGHS